MHKSTFMILGFLFLTACSQNKPTPALKKEALQEEIVKNTDIKDEVLREFIPEHIKKSKIEVVKHY